MLLETGFKFFNFFFYEREQQVSKKTCKKALILKLKINHKGSCLNLDRVVWSLVALQYTSDLPWTNSKIQHPNTNEFWISPDLQEFNYEFDSKTKIEPSANEHLTFTRLLSLSIIVIINLVTKQHFEII